jgi:hypothetical protein
VARLQCRCIDCPGHKGEADSRGKLHDACSRWRVSTGVQAAEPAISLLNTHILLYIIRFKARACPIEDAMAFGG